MSQIEIQEQKIRFLKKKKKKNKKSEIEIQCSVNNLTKPVAPNLVRILMKHHDELIEN